MNQLTRNYLIAALLLVTSVSILSAWSYRGDKDEAQKALNDLASTVKSSRSIELTIVIEAPQQEVYNKVATAKGLDSWLTTNSKISDIVGSRIEWIWKYKGNQYIGMGNAVVNKAPNIYTMQWEGPFDPVNYASDFSKDVPFELPTKTAFVFRKENDERTTVYVSIQGIKSDTKYDSYVAEVENGWKRALANLKSVSEQGKDLRKDLGQEMILGIF
jgi:uncharacterized protein YndB with AHSA1/START domain